MRIRFALIPISVAVLVAAIWLAPRPGERTGAVQPERVRESERPDRDAMPTAPAERMTFPEPGAVVAVETREAPQPQRASFTPEQARALAREGLAMFRSDEWEGEIERLCFRPAFLDASREGLTETQRATLERIRADYRAKMRPTAEHALTQIQREMLAKWDRGEYTIVRAGENPPPQPPPTNPRAYRRAGMADSGAETIYFSFNSTGYPEIEAPLAELEAFKVQYAEAQAAYLESIR